MADADRKVVIVCGPPCAGKTTWVREHAAPTDMVIDYDDIAQQLGSPRTHGHHFRYHWPTQKLITRALAAIETGEQTRAWVIRSLPTQQDRDDLAERLGAEVVVLDEPDAVLYDRARHRPNPAQTVSAMNKWRAQAAHRRPRIYHQAHKGWGISPGADPRRTEK